MALTNVCDRSWAYMLKEINYALETIIILYHTPFWSPNNDVKYVPKSQRPKHSAWLTHGIKQVTDTIKEWEVRQKSRKKMHARTLILSSYSPTTGTWYQQTKAQLSRRLRLAPRKHSRTLLSNEVITMQAHMSKHTTNASFDTNSGPVGIDNQYSGCMSNKSSDFDGEFRPVKRVIKGFGGSRTYNMMMVTIKWKVEDNSGKVHTFRIPNSYYVLDGEVRLFSPQHWAKTQKDQKPTQGTGITTLADRVTLVWHQRHFSKTVYLDAKTNVATFSLAPGYTKYHAFCTEACLLDEEITNSMSMDTNEVSNDETGKESDTEDVQSIGDDVPYDPTPREFDIDTTDLPGTAPVVVQDDEEDCQPTNVAAEFLKFYLKFNHCSPRNIQVMAEQGLLSTRLVTCAIPVCSACQFVKDPKRPWKKKTRRNGAEVERAQSPGDVNSVDQMISQTPGLIAPMAGFLTKDH